MFLMSRKIKSLGVKMVISGEGSDEIFGGYLYFHKAPNKEEFHRETCRKVCEFSRPKRFSFTKMISLVLICMCRSKPCTSMIAWERIKQHRHGVWKLACRSWTRNSSMSRWALILNGKWYAEIIIFDMINKIMLLTNSIQSWTDQTWSRSDWEVGVEESFWWWREPLPPKG